MSGDGRSFAVQSCAARQFDLLQPGIVDVPDDWIQIVRSARFTDVAVGPAVIGAIDIRVDPLLSRGSLRIHTNLGSLDAQLTPQLERLAKALRDALA